MGHIEYKMNRKPEVPSSLNPDSVVFLVREDYEWKGLYRIRGAFSDELILAPEDSRFTEVESFNVSPSKKYVTSRYEQPVRGRKRHYFIHKAIPMKIYDCCRDETQFLTQAVLHGLNVSYDESLHAWDGALSVHRCERTNEALVRVAEHGAEHTFKITVTKMEDK